MKKLTFAIFIALLVAATAVAQGQTPQSKPAPEPSPDVIRVNTELVQTNVAVFDKQGRFVDGLQREDFQLRIDGKPQPISFFTRVLAGSNLEQAQLAAARSTQSNPLLTGEAEERGRTIIFFIDDLHLSATSIQKTRETITEFLEKQMAPGDQVAIASASGQIGFLQQFTDNNAVLRAAAGRLSFHPYTVHDSEQVPMTEYAALRVDQGDNDAISYYANLLLAATNFTSVGGAVGPPRGGGAVASSSQANARAGGGSMSREMAERMVKLRAQGMLKQAANITNNTLVGLESLMRSSAQLPGRKLVFFVSDGFYLDDRNTGFGDKLRDITDAAQRAGVVIYSLDARGLTAQIDMTSNRSDGQGKLSRANIGELSASQDGLNALAGDTGGRALFNSDNLNDAVDRALKETSNYYLLSWKPTTEEQKSGNFRRVEISIAKRPELTVRLPRGYLEADANAAIARATASNKTPKEQPGSPTAVEADLRAALGSFAPQSSVPTRVAVSFLDTPGNGPVVTASVQAGTATLDYGADGKQAAIDLAGVVLNDQGKPAGSFKTRLTVGVLPANVTQEQAGVVYNYKTALKPGLYQVRAAVRDEKNGNVGSAQQWIEIPDLSARHLTLSSLMVRPATQEKKTDEAASPAQLQFSVDRRFPRSSQLSFLLFIYNATRGANGTSAPDVTAQVEVFRRGKAIIATGPRKLSTQSLDDLARIPYGGQFPLATLPAGRYDLQVTITDHFANASASQRLSFQID